MKRTGIACLLALCVLLAGCTHAPGGGRTPATTIAATTTTAAPATTTTTKPPLPADAVAAPAALLYDADDDRLLFSKEADKPMHPVSTTKLLTAVVSLLYADEDEELTVTEDVLQLVMYDASRARLEEGMRLTLRTALEGLLLPSGGDAAYLLAVHVGKRLDPERASTAKEAVAVFCDEMNRVAAALGAADSHFVNPDGYPDDRHVSTAHDILQIAREAYRFDTIREIVSAPSVTRTLLSGETMTWNNPNALLQPDSPFYYPGVNGMKSGYSSAAGHCMVIACEKGGKTYFAVVLGCPDSEQRWRDLTTLLNAC